MGEGIFSITTKDFVVQLGTQGKEEALDRLLDTGGIGLDHLMETWGGAGGTVAASTGVAGAITLYVILPVKSKNNGKGWTRNGGAKHAKGVKLVKLLKLTSSMPQGPCIKALQPTTGKVAKRLFGRSSSIGPNGANRKMERAERDGGIVARKIRKANGRDGMNISDGERWFIGGIDNRRAVDAELPTGTTDGLGRETTLRGKHNMNRSGLLIREGTEACADISSSEDGGVVDPCDVCATKTAQGGFVRGEEERGAAFGQNVGDKTAIIEVICVKDKTKGRVVAGDRKCLGEETKEGGGANIEVRDHGVGNFSGKRGASLGALEMNDVGR